MELCLRSGFGQKEKKKRNENEEMENRRAYLIEMKEIGCMGEGNPQFKTSGPIRVLGL